MQNIDMAKGRGRGVEWNGMKGKETEGGEKGRDTGKNMLCDEIKMRGDDDIE